MHKCYLIGGSSLAIKLVLTLLDHEYQILGVFSQDPKVIGFCRDKKIKIWSDLKNFYNELLSSNYDYLFSAINPRKQPKNIIESPNIAAINYHDSLLPRYAGCNATSWAILGNENTHGVTWHIMDEYIDNGPILLQEEFDIKISDTALDLNLKAYQAAHNTFKKLVKLLLNSNYIKNIQLSMSPNSNKHTKYSYYGKHQLPEHKCILQWDWGLDEISKVYRACFYGNYSNPFEKFKLIYNDCVYYIKSYKILSTSSKEKPGSLLSMADEYVFSTVQNDLAFILERKQS